MFNYLREDENTYKRLPITESKGVQLEELFPELLDYKPWLSKTGAEVESFCRTLPEYRDEYYNKVFILDGTALNKFDLVSAYLKDRVVRLMRYQTLTEEDKIERLSKEIARHLEGNKPSFKTILEMSDKLFPQFTYTGIGYRAVMVLKGQEFDVSKVKENTSWAINPEGREQFLKNAVQDGNANPAIVPEVVMVEAMIHGLSLVRLINEKFPELKDNTLLRFIKEDEVLATEIISINKIEKVKYFI